MAEVPQFTVNLPEAWIKLSVSRAKAAIGKPDGFGYTRSLDSCEDSPALGQKNVRLSTPKILQKILGNDYHNISKYMLNTGKAAVL